MSTIRQGDIFSVKTPDNRFLFGRILLDIATDCLDSGLAGENSPLFNWSDAYLVQVYNHIGHKEELPAGTPVLIRSIYVDMASFKQGIHNIVSHQPVRAAEVDFPETLVFDGKVNFEKGEIQLVVDMSEDEFDVLDCFGQVHYSGSIPDMALPLMGLHHLATHAMDMKQSDLRYCEEELEHSIKILCGYDPGKSYAQHIQEMGLDMHRFFKP